MAKKILIIEDHPDTILLLTEMFKPLGYDVIYAIDGAAGLEEAKKMQPDLILLDIMMPFMDGCEVCEKLKAGPETAHIPIIIMSVKSSEEDLKKGYRLGAIAYVVKPFDPEALEATVRDLLKNKVVLGD